MKIVDIREAKTQLSRLLEEVEDGEIIVIARDGKPVARLVRFYEKPQRALGRDTGLFEVPSDFDAPLPDSMLEQLLT